MHAFEFDASTIIQTSWDRATKGWGGICGMLNRNTYLEIGCQMGDGVCIGNEIRHHRLIPGAKIPPFVPRPLHLI